MFSKRADFTPSLAPLFYHDISKSKGVFKMLKKEMIENFEKMQNEGRKSKWRNGVISIAIDRLDEMENGLTITWHNLLNGALWQNETENFENLFRACNRYAWGGCGLIYDEDIADLLATKSGAYYPNGNFKSKPNAKEEWLDLYARAIYQAFRLIIRYYRNETIDE